MTSTLWRWLGALSLRRRGARGMATRQRGGGGVARSGRQRRDDGVWLVDVRGQTCPGYLLHINRHVEAIGADAEVRLLVTYPPCADDVRAWCAERGHAFLGIARVREHFEIVIRSGAAGGGAGNGNDA